MFPKLDPTIAAIAKRIARIPRNAVLWTRSAFPSSDMECTSYLGGLPQLPPNLDWPRLSLVSSLDSSRFDGSPTFLGQIDFADIAVFGRKERMPGRGVLYFFSDTCFVDGKPSFRVLHAPDGCTGCPERAPPSDLMRLGGSARSSGRDWLTDEEYRARVDFRYVLTPHAFKSYPDWSEADFDEHDYRQAYDAVQVAALEEVFGPIVRKESTPSISSADDSDNRKWPRLLFPTWPCSRLFFLEFSRALLHELDHHGRRRSPDKPSFAEVQPVAFAFHEEVRRELARLSQEIGEGEPLAPLPPDSRDAVRRWFVDIRGRANDFYYGIRAAKNQSVLPPWDFTRVRDESMWFCCNEWMATDGAPENADGETIRAALKDRVERWDDPIWNIDSDAGKSVRAISRPMHQTLGYGEYCHGAASENIDQILLLQIHNRGCLGWQNRFSQGCLLQFWIKQADLAARRFERVEATLG